MQKYYELLINKSVGGKTMKLCKKIISLILAVLMATSALTVVDFSAYADYKNDEMIYMYIKIHYE